MNNNKSLFIASFMTLIAAGVGFAIRGGILGDWGAQYGFTKFDLGTITGGGLVGFGVVILLASLITDNIGYKPLLLLAFILHVLSALVTFAATPVFESMGKDATYWCLYIGMFMFAVANGLCEAVINPLVATLYPRQKTHYLNILHAGWPGGLIVGGIIAAIYTNMKGDVASLRWEMPMAVFLIPTLIYGFIVIKQKFPQSEAKSAGVSFGQMLLTFASPLLLFLLLLHACVGYVELGTDSWIASITESILKKSGEGQGLYLFIYASSIMFVLRFFAGPIVEKINPLGLLFVSACFGSVGLYMIGSSEGVLWVWIAVTVYGLGKTFLWPTMLGVVGELFPKGGAITMGAMGGIGMLSAGLLGGPGIGYNQDYFATEKLEEISPQAYERYSVAKANGFLFLPKIKGLDGSKVSVLNNDGKDLEKKVEQLEKEGKTDEYISNLNSWWQGAEAFAPEDIGPVDKAGIYGGRMALKCTALVPLVMAIGYLILVLYFYTKGGYKAEVLHGEEPDGEHYTGGVEGPVE
ncbi:Major Facilitator Superfamily protein [Gimesia panareensis]|uniref:Major Facilitator Superfamily protein n=1 Tax=Gimesia panareensis TaxID=2527978 RepID=A0A517Q823_9PLAN|nr:MFS transporter [Gimesia panareensis]QDT27779.1 Major Facilitator Superfamily protein [Gimesia panareensis]